MRTELPESLLASDRGRRADEILRSCVHCGFCNATCPTYQLTGNELDGPRGRIYLIKELLESGAEAERAQQHLDRCLTCRACETTCPSGVAYGELAEIARAELEPRAQRGRFERLLRWWLLTQLPSARRFRLWARLGRWFRPLLPSRLGAAIPPVAQSVSARRLAPAVNAPASSAHFAGQRLLLLGGCVQAAATPATVEALANYLTRRGATLVPGTGEPCCGALPLHLGASARTRAAVCGWLDWIEPRLSEIDCIVSSASGCGVTLRDLDRLGQELCGSESGLAAAEQARYQALATRAAALIRDPIELIQLDSAPLRSETLQTVAWHSPCTLQHGQRAGIAVAAEVPAVLAAAGYTLTPVRDAHLCCGSAGTYSVLQPALAGQLKANKVNALTAPAPDLIATANVGCQVHLASGTPVPVRHWLELIE